MKRIFRTLLLSLAVALSLCSCDMPTSSFRQLLGIPILFNMGRGSYHAPQYDDAPGPKTGSAAGDSSRVRI